MTEFDDLVKKLVNEGHHKDEAEKLAKEQLGDKHE